MLVQQRRGDEHSLVAQEVAAACSVLREQLLRQLLKALTL